MCRNDKRMRGAEARRMGPRIWRVEQADEAGRHINKRQHDPDICLTECSLVFQAGSRSRRYKGLYHEL